RSGNSLLDAGLHTPATTYWETLHHTTQRLLGNDHPHTLTARANLAASYGSAGRTREAIDLQERVLADLERILGTDHPNTLTARGNLSTSYWLAGRTSDAIDLAELALADSERTLGTDHPHTWAVREVLERWHGEGK
ncbi:tetratricopeptide repeat protein, partial [Streptomyces bohaiensis]|uniref:tetratricopeptide repeat protein n=1 Tax=Streptomyces bohaiensis TaxID=1431344 RepID=UPI003B7A72B7